MGEKFGLRPDRAVGDALAGFALDILVEARKALDDPGNSDAVAVHDFRKAMKRWRALMRLLEPSVGDEARRWRIEARDLARALAAARDAQAALDGLADVGKGMDPSTSLGNSKGALSPRSLATIRARIEAIRQTNETLALGEITRGRLRAALSAAAETVRGWPLARTTFADVAAGLGEGYGRARSAVPDDWQQTEAETLHRLRRRVVVHRYQMDLVEPLWPRLVKLWAGEAQRLRERLGTCQDLSVLTGMTAPRQPLAPWRARLSPLIEARRALHGAAAARLATRLFADRPKAFRQRLEALWERDGGAVD